MFTYMLRTQQSIENMDATIEKTQEQYNKNSITLRKLKTEASSSPTIYELKGYIVALTDTKDLYEIAKTEYNYRLRCRVPTSNHAYFLATSSTFTTKGHFAKDVIILTSLPVTLKKEYGGFRQSWTVYKEATAEDKRIYNEILYYERKCRTGAKTLSAQKQSLKVLNAKEKKYMKKLKEHNAIEIK